MGSEQLLEKLEKEQGLSLKEWEILFQEHEKSHVLLAEEMAREIAQREFGNRIFFRGIIEFTNFCHNDCYYCGIRKSNARIKRYHLSNEEILECCQWGYDQGIRTFVLQGGENHYDSGENMIGIIQRIRNEFPDCAITLSLGEKEKEIYQRYYDAGAERYLLRQETACQWLYEKWHPKGQSMERRIQCLWDLKKIGYQVGCGILVGAPGQTPESLAMDFVMMQKLNPEMIGIGPFLPQEHTPFGRERAGSTEETLFLLSLLRILFPRCMLPATTALGSMEEDGRIRGIQRGCNVIMPNLSPQRVRKDYLLYDHKAGILDTPELGIRKLKAQTAAIGYEVVCDRGDPPGWKGEKRES